MNLSAIVDERLTNIVGSICLLLDNNSNKRYLIILLLVSKPNFAIDPVFEFFICVQPVSLGNAWFPNVKWCRLSSPFAAASSLETCIEMECSKVSKLILQICCVLLPRYSVAVRVQYRHQCSKPLCFCCGLACHNTFGIHHFSSRRCDGKVEYEH